MADPPVDPALVEERVARALCRLENERHAENVRRSLVRRDMKPTVLRYEEDKEEWDEEARAALAALTTEDLLALLQAQSDEVVVELTRDEAYWLEGAAERGSRDDIARGLGTAEALRDLAAKLGRAQ